MKNGFLYLTAIIDLYSRYIVGWGISNTLEAEASLAVMKQAVKDYGKPEIINSDQGSQFTCEEWISYLESEGIKISMDGKGRAIDNIFIDTNCIIRELTGRLRLSYTGWQHKKERKWTYQQKKVT
jgi:putative transposase